MWNAKDKSIKIAKKKPNGDKRLVRNNIQEGEIFYQNLKESGDLLANETSWQDIESFKS